MAANFTTVPNSHRDSHDTFVGGFLGFIFPCGLLRAAKLTLVICFLKNFHHLNRPLNYTNLREGLG